MTTTHPPTTEPEAIVCPSWCVQGSDHGKRELHLGPVTSCEVDPARFSVDLLREIGETDPAAAVVRLTVRHLAFQTRGGNPIEVETWLNEPAIERLMGLLSGARDQLYRVVGGELAQAATPIRQATGASWTSWPDLAEAVGITDEALADGLWGRSTFTTDELRAISSCVCILRIRLIVGCVIARHIGPLISARQAKRLTRKCREQLDAAAAWVEEHS